MFPLARRLFCSSLESTPLQASFLPCAFGGLALLNPPPPYFWSSLDPQHPQGVVGSPDRQQGEPKAPPAALMAGTTAGAVIAREGLAQANVALGGAFVDRLAGNFSSLLRPPVGGGGVGGVSREPIRHEKGKAVSDALRPTGLPPPEGASDNSMREKTSLVLSLGGGHYRQFVLARFAVRGGRCKGRSEMVRVKAH